MKDTRIDFDRIFEAWKDLESNGAVVVHNEISVLEANSANAMTAVAGSTKQRDFYSVYIKHAIVDTPNISKFFETVKDVSDEAYEFISDGHDFINPSEYFKFKDVCETERNNKVIEMKSHSRYLAYAFKKIFEQEDESKKKSILKGLLGI